MFQVLGYLLFGSLFYHNYMQNGSGSSFNDMSSFIEKQQYREDQLREQCNLQHYKLKEKPGLSDKIKESIYYMKESISSGTGDISKNLISSNSGEAIIIKKDISKGIILRGYSNNDFSKLKIINNDSFIGNKNELNLICQILLSEKPN